jgi:16S rRNA processing protein RimM
VTVATAPLLAVGEVLRPHGLGGHVKVRALTDRPRDRFRSLRECVLWNPATDHREVCRVESCRVEGETVLVKVAGIDSPEEARRLGGLLVAVDREAALPAEPGTFYPWQLEGARVETSDGRLVGTFVRVEPGAAQDLWVIRQGEREVLVPAVAEIVRDVSVAERRVVIDPPEGLLEL